MAGRAKREPPGLSPSMKTVHRRHTVVPGRGGCRDGRQRRGLGPRGVARPALSALLGPRREQRVLERDGATDSLRGAPGCAPGCGVALEHVRTSPDGRRTAAEPAGALFPPRP